MLTDNRPEPKNFRNTTNKMATTPKITDIILEITAEALSEISGLQGLTKSFSIIAALELITELIVLQAKYVQIANLKTNYLLYKCFARWLLFRPPVELNIHV